MSTKRFQGAIAAIICAASFIIGLMVVLIIVPDFNHGPEYRLAVFAQHKLLMQFWYFCVYVVFSIALLFLSRALLTSAEEEPTFLEQITVLASYMWACYIFACGVIAILSIEFLYTVEDGVRQMSELWRQIYAIQMGLGEGVEWVGGIWVVLMNSCLYLRQQFPKALLFSGFFISFIGLLTLYRPLAEVGALFGLLQIGWFVAVSYSLFKAAKVTR